jgi:hypothetical protein
VVAVARVCAPDETVDHHSFAVVSDGMMNAYHGDEPAVDVEMP